MDRRCPDCGHWVESEVCAQCGWHPHVHDGPIGRGLGSPFTAADLKLAAVYLPASKKNEMDILRR